MTGQTTSTTAVTEEERFDMANALEAKLGRSTTMTLMKHLPPTGWGDVATIRDLDQLEAKLNARFETMDAIFEKRLALMQASILKWNVATMLTLVSVVAIITLTLR
jgi:hypothetical protein